MADNDASVARLATLSTLPLEIKVRICELAALQDERYKERWIPGALGEELVKVHENEWRGRSLAALSETSKELNELAATYIFHTLTDTQIDSLHFTLIVLAQHSFRRVFAALPLLPNLSNLQTSYYEIQLGLGDLCYPPEPGPTGFVRNAFRAVARRLSTVTLVDFPTMEDVVAYLGTCSTARDITISVPTALDQPSALARLGEYLATIPTLERLTLNATSVGSEGVHLPTSWPTLNNLLSLSLINIELEATSVALINQHAPTLLHLTLRLPDNSPSTPPPGFPILYPFPKLSSIALHNTSPDSFKAILVAVALATPDSDTPSESTLGHLTVGLKPGGHLPFNFMEILRPFTDLRSLCVTGGDEVLAAQFLHPLKKTGVLSARSPYKDAFTYMGVLLSRLMARQPPATKWQDLTLVTQRDSLREALAHGEQLAERLHKVRRAASSMTPRSPTSATEQNAPDGTVPKTIHYSESDSFKLFKCSCLYLAYCGKDCQRANWPQHRSTCSREIAKRNRAEETSLATPLGDAFILDSMRRWSDEIWRPHSLDWTRFIHISESENDFPVIAIDLQHQPNATELHLQWRPTAYKLLSFDSLPIPTLPTGFRSKYETIRSTPIMKGVNGEREVRRRIFSLKFFHNTNTKEDWNNEFLIDKHAATYFAQASEEWRTLAREHWANLNRAEERYFRRRFEAFDFGYHFLTQLAYCQLEIARRNRAEEFSLAAPLGEAFILDSADRWREEIWLPYGGFFFKFIHIPDYVNDLPVVLLDLEHQPNETEVHLQWRPTGFTVRPFRSYTSDEFVFPSEFVAKLDETWVDPLAGEQESQPTGIRRIVLIRQTFFNSDKSRTSQTMCTFHNIRFEAPCSLNPASTKLDWMGAWFSFMQIAPKEIWRYEGNIEEHAAVYFGQTSDEWKALAREHWASLNRAEERYFRQRYAYRNMSYHELTGQAYVLTYRYGEMESGWIPPEDREGPAEGS
ncbi:hypothetical protein RQP46_002427 [Phenoliferia psychrophenolica]